MEDYLQKKSSTILLETERLILRDYMISDLKEVHAWMSDPEVMLYLEWKTSSMEETKENLLKTINDIGSSNRNEYYFAMIEKETQKHIGGAGFKIITRKHNSGIAELGYFLSKDYWGKGIAVEAVLRIIKFGFVDLKLHKISASCDSENRGSERIMQKCGLSKEGELRKERFHRNRWCNRLLYSILKEEREIKI